MKISCLLYLLHTIVVSNLNFSIQKKLTNFAILIHILTLIKRSKYLRMKYIDCLKSIFNNIFHCSVNN